MSEIEHQISIYQEMIEKSDKLEKLMKNREFKELILKDLFENEAQRLVGALANVQEERKAAIIAELDMISRLRRHLLLIEQIKPQAEAAIRELQEAVLEDFIEAE